MRKTVTGSFTLVLLLSALMPVVAHADDQVRGLLFQGALAARDQAQSANAETYSPRNYARGTEALGEAERDFELDRPLERIRTALAQATQHFSEATQTANQARDELAPLIKLRAAAASVSAGLHDEANWQAAERKFKEAIIEFERGDLRLAQRRAGEAETPYRQAELAGIKAAYLNEARRLIGQADKAKAQRYAPTTYARAQQLLATAEKELTENRYDTDRPRDLARRAQNEASHALYLARTVQSARKKDAEELILAGEMPLRQIAAAADLSVSFDQGYEPATELIIDYIKELQQNKRENEQQLFERLEQVETLEQQLSLLETRLGGISEERSALEAQLARQAQERERFARIESMFTEDQADVLRDGGAVVIRLVGTSFPVGKATIEPPAYGLLRTVMQAIGVFPGADVSIEGHTDAYGGDALNMNLSRERAAAVQAYLLANMNIEPARLSASGFGETRPIANNETEEGRARNRRIDIVIRP